VADPLVTLAQVRAEGLTVAQASDAKVTEAIQLASDLVERLCRTSFTTQTYTTAAPLLLNGTGHDTIWFDDRVRTVTEIGIQTADGTQQTAYNATSYRLFASRTPSARDFRNPKVQRLGARTFREGLLNVYLAGTVGTTELVGGVESVPLLIQRAVLILVIQDFAWLLTDDARQKMRLGRFVKSQTTEGHRYVLSDIAFSGAYSGIREVDRILRLYSPPLGVRA